MKQTSRNTLEDLDTTLNALQGEVAKMKGMLLSAKISLEEPLASLNAKHQEQVTQLALVDGRKKRRQKRKIMRMQERSNKKWFYLHWLSRQEASR